MKKHLLALLAALLILPAIPASATILFAGGEDIDFNCTGTCAVVTTSGTYRSSFARESYTVNGSATDPPPSRFASPTFSGAGSLWIHAQYCHTNGGCNANGASNATTSNAQMLRIMDDAGNPTLIIRGTGTAGQVKVSSRTSGGVFTDLVTCSGFINNTAATTTQIDVFLNYAASGEITLYNGSSQVCDYTGDVTNGDGATTITGAQMGSASTSFAGAWSEVIAATTDTRSKSLYRLTPNGNGNATAWTGANPCTAILNASSFNDTSYVNTSTNNQLEQCTTTNSIPAGTWNVDAVVMSARIQRGATGPQHFQFVTRTGGSDFTSADQNPTASFSNIGNYIQATNPGTAAIWTTGDLTAAGFNIGLKSTP